MNRVPTAATAPSTSPFAHLSLVPAVVDGVQVPVACPATWCTQDHTGEDATKHLDDIDHSGAHVNLMIPNARKNNDVGLFAYVRLGQDVYNSDHYMSDPHLRFEDGGGEETTVTLDQGLAFADRLVEFAEQIRGLVRTAQTGGAA
ncbi:DUF6907 domain-containing protein [Streptomyces sp. NPDC054813]